MRVINETAIYYSREAGDLRIGLAVTENPSKKRDLDDL